MKFLPFQSPPQHQCCSIVYDPEVDRQILCHQCRTFLHITELRYDETQDLHDPFSRVIRGFGWEESLLDSIGWSLVGTRNIRLDGDIDDDHFDVVYTVTDDEEKQALDEIKLVLETIKGVWECKNCGDLL